MNVEYLLYNMFQQKKKFGGKLEGREKLKTIFMHK